MFSRYQQMRAAKLQAFMRANPDTARTARSFAREIGELWPRPWRAHIHERDVPPEHRLDFRCLLFLINRRRLTLSEWTLLRGGDLSCSESWRGWWTARTPRPDDMTATRLTRARAWFRARVDVEPDTPKRRTARPPKRTSRAPA